ncbi:unnamed protein product [Gongylonema pulchrum]|uniref:Uncharacterized protein n=1 Tax=Gongylonema pulchrum TaxID=637853 RepID=A0A183EET9_9BILA|nr:unnamed protein product [Gongylonema pulchrum]
MQLFARRSFVHRAKFAYCQYIPSLGHDHSGSGDHGHINNDNNIAIEEKQWERAGALVQSCTTGEALDHRHKTKQWRVVIETDKGGYEESDASSDTDGEDDGQIVMDNGSKRTKTQRNVCVGVIAIA